MNTVSPDSLAPLPPNDSEANAQPEPSQNLSTSLPSANAMDFPRSTQTASGAGASAEILPGYTVERPIGSGGFGEVFLCEAPGGIKKAVKVVYGTLDDERAEREMRSLERIKDIRHPFLISLDRIEIVNQQLVFVTELADRSLKQRFTEASNDGLQGIPRDELLRYMKDAAEALDYLYEKHTLQHLDVKPENLLLVGEHLKVADFGLIKDLRESEMSMIGGVTPLYSPPEVLDGRPNRHSDQYSLAIVYQEMLTGELPFNGRTAGQLAAQHMHSAPVLSKLPTSDRYAIGKALAKSPTRRFENCRELVDALVNPPKRAAYVRHQTDEGDSESVEESAASNSPLLRQEEVATKALPPIEELCDSTRPAVVIGVGGMGGTVIRSLRKQLNERFGSESAIPSLRLLYIDTDREAISDAGRESWLPSLEPNEVLSLPLRSAQGYREQRSELLPWLSRRWLYNIPRSQRTEGIRPLGRLALVDHAASVRERITTLIRSAAESISVQESKIATGVAFTEQAPRVFVISSTVGGTGSGMWTDLGYLAQRCLEAEKLNGSVVGIALSGTGVRVETHELAEVNTIATLGELYHFGQDSERYPGDAVFDSAPTGRSPFQSSYSLFLGRELDERDICDHANRIASYLSSSIIGTSAGFFDTARSRSDQRESTVRSFGVGVLGGNSEHGMPAADALCDAVLARWSEKCREELDVGGNGAEAAITQSEAIDASATGALKQLELLDAESPEIDIELESRLDICKGMIAESWTASGKMQAAGRFEATFAMVEAALSGQSDATNHCDAMLRCVVDRANQHRDNRLKVIRETIFTPPVEGVPGIEDSLGMMYAVVRELVNTQQACDSRSKQRRSEVDALRREGPPSISDRSKKIPDALMAFFVSYCRLRLNETAESARASELQALVAETMSTSQFFQRVSKSLDAARDGFARVSTGRTDLDEDAVDRFEERVRNDVLGRVGPFWPMVITEPKHRQGFVKAMRQVADDAVGERCLAIATAASSAEGSDDPVRSAKPLLPTKPGGIRWLVSGPSAKAVEPLAARIHRQFGQKPTVVIGGDGRVTLFCESENIPISNVTRELIGRRVDHLETASRVHSRHDVQWTC